MMYIFLTACNVLIVLTFTIMLLYIKKKLDHKKDEYISSILNYISMLEDKINIIIDKDKNK